MTDLRIALGQTLKAARLKRGLSQTNVAIRMGFKNPRSRSYLTRVERAHTQPTLEMLARLADALDTTGSNLLANAEKIARRREIGRRVCGSTRGTA